MRIGYESIEEEPCDGKHGPEVNCSYCHDKAVAKARARARAILAQDGDPDAARDIAIDQEEG